MQAAIPLVELWAVNRRLPKHALFSGQTAAWLHGLDVLPWSPIEVTLPRSSTTSRISGVVLKRSDVDRTDATLIQDLPATSRVRTFADLGRRLPLVEAISILDMALHRRLITIDTLKGWAHMHPRYRGAGRLMNTLDLTEPATESPMETRLRLLLITNGLPRPKAQESLHDSNGVFLARADLYYTKARLVIEYDGLTHRTRLASDNRRQNRLLEAGYRLLRFTAADVLHRPASVVAQVGRALV